MPTVRRLAFSTSCATARISSSVTRSKSPGAVITTNRIMAAVFLVLTVASFIAPLVEGVNLNPPDTILHLASALLTAFLGWPVRTFEVAVNPDKLG